MGNISSQSINMQQSTTNDIVQSSKSVCNATQTQSVSGNYIDIRGSSIISGGGDVDLIKVAGSQMDLTCALTNTMDSTVESILSAIANQSSQQTSGPFFNGLSLNIDKENVKTNQSVVNNISQLNEQVCTASKIQSVNNNFIFLDGSKIQAAGNITAINVTASDMKAVCALDNTMKNIVYNDLKADSQQKSVQSVMIAAIFGAIVFIVVLGAICFVLYLFMRPGKSSTPTLIQTGTEQPTSTSGITSSSGITSGTTIPSTPST